MFRNNIGTEGLKVNSVWSVESSFTGFREATLYYQFFPSHHHENSSGSIVLTHGQGEHIDVYLPLIHFLQGHGWNIYAWDLRGHGKSSGKRGYAYHFNDYIKDFILFLRKVVGKRLHQKGLSTEHPIVCFSHSVGALIQSKTFLMEKGLEQEVGIQGQVMSCPCFGLKMEVPQWKTRLGEFVHRLYPKFTMESGISDFQLLQKPSETKDVFRHHLLSFSVYKGILESSAWLMKKGFGDVQIPTFIQLSGKELVCDNERTEILFNQIKKAKKNLKIYSQSLHEIYGDVEKKQVYNDLCTFLKDL